MAVPLHAHPARVLAGLPLVLPLALPLVACATASGAGDPDADPAAARAAAQAPGAQDPGAQDPGAEDPGGEDPAGEDAAVEAALAAIRAGEYERARDRIDDLIVRDCVARSRRLLAEGRPREALDPMDRALELADDDPEVLFLRGRVAYATAPGDSQPQFFYEDAVGYYERAFRASLLGREREAAPSGRPLLTDAEIRIKAELARARLRVPDVEGSRTEVAQLEAAREDRTAAGRPWPELETPLERLHAEASFQAFLEARNAGLEGNELYFETEDQLSATVGYAAHRRWALSELANLYLWGGQTEAAVEALQRAIELNPDDQALHDRLVALLDASPEGRAASIAYYERFRADHPESPLGPWYGAVELFYATLERLEAEDRDEQGFRDAEALFRRCRELEPAYAERCTAYEAVCRSGVAWCRYHEGDLEGAEAAFLSMEDVREGGLRISLGQRLTDGVTGLGFLIGKYIEDPSDVEANLHAARIGDRLHAYDPTDGDLANNAGFLNRDAAVMLETRWRVRRSRAMRLDPGPEQDDLLAAAQADLDLALEVMRRSWEAYLVAAELLPEDVRVVNDAGLVMTYYLRTDADAAERLLRQADENGRAQLAVTELEGEALFQLQEAWGDANQNLGVLYLTLRDDPKTARGFFETSLEAGTPSREWVRTQLLPVLDRVLAGEDVPASEYPRALQYWAHQPSED